jgi:hypothetical protein
VTACGACQHPKRAALDAAIVAGDSLRMLAARFGISKSTLHRHKTQHLLEAIAYEGPAAGPEVWGDLLAKRIEALGDRAERLFGKAEDVMRRAERRRDGRTVLSAIKAASGVLGELRGALELNAKLAGQLRDGMTVNVLVMPEWQRLRGAILAAVEPFPEARAAMVKALEVGSAHE